MFKFITLSAACLSLTACALIPAPDHVIGYGQRPVKGEKDKWEVGVSATSEFKAREMAADMGVNILKNSSCKTFEIVDIGIDARTIADHVETTGRSYFNPYNKYAGIQHQESSRVVYVNVYNFRAYVLLRGCPK